MKTKICNCCEVEKIPQSEQICGACVLYCEHLGIKKNKIQVMSFQKFYDNSTVKIWECINTKLKIEYWKFKKFYVLFDENNMIVWEFDTLNEAKQAAKDYIFSTN